MSISTRPVTGAMYRKNTSAPSSKQDVAEEVVAQRVEKGVIPSNRANAPATLLLAGGMHGVAVESVDVVPGAVEPPEDAVEPVIVGCMVCCDVGTIVNVGCIVGWDVCAVNVAVAEV